VAPCVIGASRLWSRVNDPLQRVFELLNECSVKAILDVACCPSEFDGRELMLEAFDAGGRWAGRWAGRSFTSVAFADWLVACSVDDWRPLTLRDAASKFIGRVVLRVVYNVKKLISAAVLWKRSRVVSRDLSDTLSSRK
jgi:hypothetical protein